LQVLAGVVECFHMEKAKYNFASLFGNSPILDEEKLRVGKQIEDIGGLTFKINFDEEGWTAVCKEVPAIIASNTNPTPTTIEIESQIRDAIFSAFNVQLQKTSSEVESPFRFEYSIAK